MNVNISLLKKLNSLQKKLLRENQSEYIIANDSLNVVKGHPYYLKSFKDYNFIKYFKLIIRYSLINIYYLLGSLFYYKNKVYKSKKNIDFLLISHLISSKKSSSNSFKDFYFGEFEKNKNFKNKKNLKILINHTKKFKSGYNNDKNIVLQNYTNFKYSIFSLIKLYNLFLKYYFISIRKKELKINLLKIIALEFLNPKTFKNLILKKNFEDIIFGKNIKKIFFTYEGFAWERFLCEIVKKNNKSTEVVGYQFAILIKNQNSIFSKIQNKYIPDKILTSGPVNYKILKKKFSNISIIGSARFVKIKKKISNSKETCLVLPEGIDSECDILLDFVNSMATKIPKIKFVFRFHPSTNILKMKKQLKKVSIDQKFNNVEISTKSLPYDLSRSTMCLHRGSTSVIAAAQSGLMPIYYDFENKLNIDPMFQIDKSYRYVKNFNEFKNLVKMSKKKKKFILKKINKFSRNYFVEFNHQKLNNILNH